MKHNFVIVASLLLVTLSARCAVVDLEDKTLAANTYYNGADQAGGFTSRGAFFNNNYDATYGSYDGWSYSNVVNPTTPGYGNQYASFPGGGSDANGAVAPGQNYSVNYADGYINLPTGTVPQSARVTNTTYTALSMKNGDSFAKKFGGATGNDPDFFDVTFTGYSGLGASGSVTGATTFYLADYRFADNSKDYIVNDWENVDLTSLGSAASIGITYASSDVGQFGINTPTYFALDNLVTAVPEPATSLAALPALVALALVRRASNHRSARANA